MSKFNTKKTPTSGIPTVNYAGGQAYTKSAELELVTILLTSFVEDQFYRTSNDTLNRMSACLSKVDAKFAAKAAIYARNEFGMRSITHVLGAELAKYISGQPWGKEFYAQVVRRPDDMTEIVSVYFGNKKNKSLPNSLKKGFAKAFEKFDAYQLAKYRGEGKEISLIDIANMVHPSYVERNGMVEVDRAEYLETLNASLENATARKNKERVAELKALIKKVKASKKETYPINAIEALMIGALKNTQTWEAKLSEAGKKAESEDEKDELKKEAWASLIKTRKIGYMALLKNLRNIMTQAPELVDEACALLVDVKLIRNSLVLPFRFTTAIEEINKFGSKESRKIVQALEDAIEIACENVPKLPGETCVIYDRSGSMSGRPTQIGGLFAAILAKSNNADVVLFGTAAEYTNFSLRDSIFTINKQFNHKNMGGTSYQAFFQKLNKKYDRLIILSDGEAWQQMDASQSYLNQYKSKYGCNPFVYNFDLQGSPTLQFKGERVITLAGFSEKVFDLMKVAEQDKNVLINTIKNYSKLD